MELIVALRRVPVSKIAVLEPGGCRAKREYRRGAVVENADGSVKRRAAVGLTVSVWGADVGPESWTVFAFSVDAFEHASAVEENLTWAVARGDGGSEKWEEEDV